MIAPATRVRARAALILAIALASAPPLAPSKAWARVYGEAELAAFEIAGVKLGMDLREATKVLAAHQYTGTPDYTAPTLTYDGPAGATVTLEQDRATGRVAAIGLFLPTKRADGSQAKPDQILPGLIKRFGEPTTNETRSGVTVLAYLSAQPGPGVVSLSLRVSNLGIDGRLGR